MDSPSRKHDDEDALLLKTELAGAVGIPLPPVRYDDSWGVNARVGYRALPFLALETEYEWLDGIGILTPIGRVAEYRPQTLTGNVKLIAPTWRVQPYLVAGGGVGFWRVDVAPDRSGAARSVPRDRTHPRRHRT